MQMNKDAKVHAANIAELFLGSIKIYNDTESLINPTNLKEVQTLINKLGKDEYYDIISNYLTREYGAGIDIDDIYSAEDVIEVLASKSDDIIKEIVSKIPDAVTSTIIDKGEDAILYALDPYLYYMKHGTQGLYDTTGMHKLMDSYKECMINNENHKYVGYIIVPQKERNKPSAANSDISNASKRRVVTTDSCDLRGTKSRQYQHFITIPANTELELIGSITGDNGELYYEVIYGKARGYTPANEVEVR